jgi:3-oxoadipate enol-lactonase
MRDRKDYVDLLGGFTPPALVIGADQDQAVPVENSNILAEGLPDAESCIMHGGGHMVNLEQQEGFNDALLGFLAGL